MTASPWLAARQARDALRAGRPDDAHRLLDPLVADGHRRAVAMLADVARGYVARGEKFLRHDNPDGAWKELLAAESLNTGDPSAAVLRAGLTRIGLAECRAALEAGKPQHVIQTITRLNERNCRHPDLPALQEIAKSWAAAAEAADRGDFLLAKEAAEALRPRLPCPPTGLDAFLLAVDGRRDRFRTAVGKLAEAAKNRDWQASADAADEVIAVAPAHRDARAAQLRAWDAVQPATMPYVPNPEALPVANRASVGAASVSGSGTGLPKRFLLWVDGVGGYLVCLGTRVTFGQATGDGPIDVPLFADVSRLHAELTRDGEGYVLESGRGAQVNGAAATRAALACGDRITLGGSCQFLFRLPVPVSPTAKLEVVSGHRLPMAVDGVLLMAENLILGPGEGVHVALRGIASNVVLYRSKDGIGVKYAGSFLVDNSPCRDRATVPLPGVVSADGFTFALEPVAARL